MVSHGWPWGLGHWSDMAKSHWPAVAGHGHADICSFGMPKPYVETNYSDVFGEPILSPKRCFQHRFVPTTVFHWLAGWLAGWLALVGWLIGWLAMGGWLAGWNDRPLMAIHRWSIIDG